MLNVQHAQLKTPDQLKAEYLAAGLQADNFTFRPKPVYLADGKTVAKGADGKDLKTKRDTFVGYLPYITADSLAALLKDETTSDNAVKFLVDLANDKIFEAAQAQITELIASNEFIILDQNLLNLKACEFMTLAVAPKTTRGIPKEIWESAKEDFQIVMVEQFGITKDGALKAAKALFDDQINSYKSNKPILKLLAQYLNNWYPATSEASQATFAGLFGALTSKFESYEKLDEESILNGFK